MLTLTRRTILMCLFVLASVPFAATASAHGYGYYGPPAYYRPYAYVPRPYYAPPPVYGYRPGGHHRWHGHRGWDRGWRGSHGRPHGWNGGYGGYGYGGPRSGFSFYYSD